MTALANLLNVVQRPDGSLDPEVEQLIEQMAAWIKIYGEAIYGTRPRQIYGEGAVKTKGGSFKEDFKYSAQGHPVHHRRVEN